MVSALGNLAETWEHLLAGHSGIQLSQPFSELAPKPLGLIGKHPACLADLTRQVVQDAIADAGLPVYRPTCGVVIGSSRGNQAQWEDWARQYYSSFLTPHSRSAKHSRQHPLPPSWLDFMPHAAAMTAAQTIGTSMAVRSPMAACATGLWAISQGYELIRSGEYDQVITGAIEAPITRLTLTGFDQMGALAKTGAYPFDREREGLVLGEGGAVLVLESEDSARQRGARIYGHIRGVGLTADGYHVSAPEPGSPAAIAAVTQCLQRSQLQPADIHFIHAHGTATRLNDQNEAHLIEKLFPAEIPVSSTKGATGHTIGGSGALGMAFCLLALQNQQLPPTVGLKQPDFALNFITRAQHTDIQNVMCLSFGFGGQNAAISISNYRFEQKT